tara:strand:+ start:7002 stop:8099 length:1098 start_codon:yes stop_codon:yes gene_type:complete
MYKILYPRRDSTIYEKDPNKNTGVDEILELTKFTVGEPHDDVLDENASWDKNYSSRILLDFDVSGLTNVDTGSAQYYLSLISTESEALPVEYTIKAFPIAENWLNGNGHYNSDPEIRNGVSWYFVDNYQDQTAWDSGSGTIEYTSATGGGSWNASYYASQSFSYDTPDVLMDVSPIVSQWVSGSIPNYGFLIKHTAEAETNDDTIGTVKFFGTDTHTIYIPTLKVFWSDGDEYTGSFTTNTEITEDYVIYMRNLKGTYTEGENVKLRIGIRDMFPTKTYATSSVANQQLKLPTTSYFSIVDYVTNTEIVPYNTIGTKIQTDDKGHYIKLDLTNFLPTRYYKILFKIVLDGDTHIIDNNFNFRVEK